MRGIDGERRQHGKDLGHEEVFEPCPVARQQVRGADDGDVRRAELAAQDAPRRLLVAHQLAGPRVDRRELLRRRQPSWLGVTMSARTCPFSPATRTM